MEFLGFTIEQSSLLYRFVIAGGAMMFVLIPLSIFALGFILQSFIRLRRERIAPPRVPSGAEGVDSLREYADYRGAIAEDDSPLGRAVLGYLKAAERREPATPEENPAPLLDEIDRLHHSITPLAVVYTIAPLVGLLGTILGLMNTFYQYAVVRQQDLEVLSVGINEALVTTMWGLCIAIPAYVFTAVLRGKIFRYEKDVFPRVVAGIMRSCEAFARAGGAEKPAEVREAAEGS